MLLLLTFISGFWLSHEHVSWHLLQYIASSFDSLCLFVSYENCSLSILSPGRLDDIKLKILFMDQLCSMRTDCCLVSCRQSMSFTISDMLSFIIAHKLASACMCASERACVRACLNAV